LTKKKKEKKEETKTGKGKTKGKKCNQMQSNPNMKQRDLSSSFQHNNFGRARVVGLEDQVYPFLLFG